MAYSLFCVCQRCCVHVVCVLWASLLLLCSIFHTNLAVSCCVRLLLLGLLHPIYFCSHFSQVMSVPLFFILLPFKFVRSLSNSSVCALGCFSYYTAVCSVCSGAHSDVALCSDKGFPSGLYRCGS